MRVTFPNAFIMDCFDSDCDVGDINHSTKANVTLEMTLEQAAELRSRAHHYAHGGLDGAPLWMKRSAQIVLDRLDEAEAIMARRAAIFWGALDGGVFDLEELAKLAPAYSTIVRAFTSIDRITVFHRPDWCPPFRYAHNDITVERDRAVELIGERR